MDTCLKVIVYPVPYNRTNIYFQYEIRVCARACVRACVWVGICNCVCSCVCAVSVSVSVRVCVWCACARRACVPSLCRLTSKTSGGIWSSTTTSNRAASLCLYDQSR